MVGGLIGLLIQVIVLGLVFYLIYWLVGVIGLPDPFRKVVLVILALIAVLMLLDLVFGLGGSGRLFWRPWLGAGP